MSYLGYSCTWGSCKDGNIMWEMKENESLDSGFNERGVYEEKEFGSIYNAEICFLVVSRIRTNYERVKMETEGEWNWK